MTYAAFGKPAPTPREDPFIARFLARLPAAQRDAFTADQLLLVKMALGAREWGDHAVDLRRAFRLWKWRFYFVFLLGAGPAAPRRSPILRPLGTVLAAFLLVTLGLGGAMLGLALLYAAKRALGIDLVPGVDMLDDRLLEGLLGLS